MTTKAKYWEPIIESYATSGLSQLKFCQEHQISYVQFCYYLKKSKTGNMTSLNQSFEPITITKKSATLMSDRIMDLTVHLPNTIRFDIKIEQGSALSILLKELVALC